MHPTLGIVPAVILLAADAADPTHSFLTTVIGLVLTAGFGTATLVLGRRKPRSQRQEIRELRHEIALLKASLGSVVNETTQVKDDKS